MTTDAALLAELRAITTVLRLGGLDMLRRVEITRSETGVTATLRAETPALPEALNDGAHHDR